MLISLRSYLRSSTRDQTADLLKGIAVVFMVQVHLVEQFVTQELFESIVGRVSLFLGGPPAAPVFLSVMGFFIGQSKKPSFALVRRGMLLIVGGILLNLGLNANLLLSIYRGRFQHDPLAFIFGADILPAAGLSVVICAALRPLLGSNAIAYLAAAVGVATVAPFLPSLGTEGLLPYINPFLWGDAWWSYFPLFPWLAYVLLGVAFAHARRSIAPRLTSSRLWLIAFALLGALGFTAADALASITTLPSYYHHGLPLMLWISGFLVLWLLAVNALESHAGETTVLLYLKWLGRHVTPAYVFQWLLIGNLATELYRTQVGNQLVLWFVTILAATSLLVAAYRHVAARRVTSSAPSS